MSSNLNSAFKNKNPNPRQRPAAMPQIRNKPVRGASGQAARGGQGIGSFAVAPPAQASPVPTFQSDATDPSTFMSPGSTGPSASTPVPEPMPTPAPGEQASFKRGGLVRRGYGKARGA